jgi:hypothetical protein
LNSEETIKTTTSNIRNFINPFTITPFSLFDALSLSPLYHLKSQKRGVEEKKSVAAGTVWSVMTATKVCRKGFLH